MLMCMNLSGMYLDMDVLLLGLYGPPAAAQFRQRSAGQSRRRESLSNYTYSAVSSLS